MTSAARLDGVSYAYPGSRHLTLDRVTLELSQGEVVVLAGPSGSGKTTILRTLAGLVPRFHGGVVSGTVTVGGTDLATSSAGAIAERVGILFQEPETQGVLGQTLRDVAFSLQTRQVPAPEILPRAHRALAEMDAAHLAARELASLSAGERQRVALAAVLAPDPLLLLLDEPTGQLDDATAERVAAVLRARANEGCTVLVAEHRLDRVESIADRILTVDGGRVTTGVPQHGEQVPAPRSPMVSRPVLVTRDLAIGRGERPVLTDVDLELGAGEAVALVGPNGSGKTTLLRVLAGLDPPRAGRVFLDGEDVTTVPAERRFPRVSMLPQDPLRYLLCERADAEVAFALEALGEPRGQALDAARDGLASVGLGHVAASHPRDLSVGERERVALAAAIVAAPGVLLLDEPTRGLDASRRARVAEIVRELTASGSAVLLATHDSDVAAACCTRSIELRRGRACERVEVTA